MIAINAASLHVDICWHFRLAEMGNRAQRAADYAAEADQTPHALEKVKSFIAPDDLQ